MDPNDLINKISKKTKAVIVVHMFGVPADLTKIKKYVIKKRLYSSKIQHGVVEANLEINF